MRKITILCLFTAFFGSCRILSDINLSGYEDNVGINKFKEKGRFSSGNYKDSQLQLPVKLAIRNSANNSYAILTREQDNALEPYEIRFEVRPGDYSFNGSRSQIHIEPEFINDIDLYFRLVKYEYQNPLVFNNRLAHHWKIPNVFRDQFNQFLFVH